MLSAQAVNEPKAKQVKTNFLYPLDEKFAQLSYSTSLMLINRYLTTIAENAVNLDSARAYVSLYDRLA
jgi:hypothetical protein